MVKPVTGSLSADQRSTVQLLLMCQQVELAAKMTSHLAAIICIMR